jgi:pimeloyl-ACP methyl ester carboxylesterase
MTNTLTVAGGTLGYDVTGPADGKLVICSPGMGDVRQEYRFLAPLLARAGYRVATVDLRGHGDSSVGWDSYAPEVASADLLALIRHLGGGPAVLIGASYSPSMAVAAAADEPGAVAGLVLISMFTGNPRLNPIMKALSGLVMSRAGLWLAYYGSLYNAKPADFADYRARLKANLRQPGRMAAVKAAGTVDKTAANARMPEIACPTLVVYGGKDPDFPDPAAEARAAMAMLSGTGARLEIVEDAKHYPHVEEPDRVAGMVLPLLAEAFGA